MSPSPPPTVTAAITSPTRPLSPTAPTLFYAYLLSDNAPDPALHSDATHKGPGPTATLLTFANAATCAEWHTAAATAIPDTLFRVSAQMFSVHGLASAFVRKILEVLDIDRLEGNLERIQELLEGNAGQIGDVARSRGNGGGGTRRGGRGKGGGGGEEGKDGKVHDGGENEKVVKFEEGGGKSGSQAEDKKPGDKKAERKKTEEAKAVADEGKPGKSKVEKDKAGKDKAQKTTGKAEKAERTDKAEKPATVGTEKSEHPDKRKNDKPKAEKSASLDGKSGRDDVAKAAKKKEKPKEDNPKPATSKPSKPGKEVKENENGDNANDNNENRAVVKSGKEAKQNPKAVQEVVPPATTARPSVPKAVRQKEKSSQGDKLVPTTAQVCGHDVRSPPRKVEKKVVGYVYEDVAPKPRGKQ
ncbi:hypothetical protein EJ06DRAFT_548855 [Trichodelitschia bisporula]|uniref:Uncharacterized protein n=1 Tax=Trichodelitschia bisporula TaxID=703511 RepID=A0A6G1HY27_9PEZI|nr:hypothetical protein EJ06DRAFT_548855 [Trichodelitschia bisporula]